jgi:asparagine synthase (glutamine-hydrolysing)
MCGICGAVSLDGLLDPDVRAAIPAMTRALRHRGPDGEGWCADERVAFGHRRLAIIDRASGQQPMANEDRTVWVVFNGEIYNHHALRRELVGRGHEFRTASDTEAIVHAYEEWGEECVARLHGMFAFAAWNSRRQELLLARDRLGKKPLFFAELGGALHFASEIKAIRQSPAWNGEIEPEALEAYLALGYIPAPQTIYRQVRKLEPAQYLVMKGNRLRLATYWDVSRFDDDERPAEAITTDIEETLRTAVIDRLESDVPLGAFLSGGIDSGLVVSYMAEEMDRPVTTCSVGFGEPDHDERWLAARTAARWRTNHVEETVESDFGGLIDTVVDAFDEPFADSSAIPTYLVSGAARRFVTVALSGDGGDETFGGYGFRYLPHLAEHHVRRLLPNAAGRVLACAGQHWPRGPRVPRILRWASILDNLGGDDAAAYYADLCFTKPAVVNRVLGQSRFDWRGGALFDVVTAPYRRCPSPDPIQKAQYADLKMYLPNDVLVKVDRMSMAHGLEIRSPLLDHRIVERAFAIPRAEKFRGYEAKAILRRIAARRLPQEVLRAPKHGFTAPVGDWLAGPQAAPEFRAIAQPGSAVSGWIDVSVLGRLYEQHRTGQANHASLLWAVLLLERWAQRQSWSGVRAEREMVS